MKHLFLALALSSIGILSQSSQPAQKAAPPAPLPTPISMPPDRAADSYQIYSQLLEHGQIEGTTWDRTFWLVEEATTSERPDVPCFPDGQKSNNFGMNPHSAIQAPSDRAKDLKALLDDYDLHCHERIQLKRDSFQVQLPIRLADDDTKKNFFATHLGPTQPGPKLKAEFEGAAGIHSFSEVYFTPNHDLAMVSTGVWCGGLCGEWRWVVLERNGGRWTPLNWVHTFVVS